MFIHRILKNNTLLCISYSTCPTVYVNRYLLCLTFGRGPTKGRNNVGIRNLRIRHYLQEHRIVLAICASYFWNRIPKISSAISKAKYVCVIGDRSTVTTLKEQEMWFIRSCNSVVVNVHFEAVRKLMHKILLKVCKLW